MRRLTTDNQADICASLNMFFAKDAKVWVRGGGEAPDYKDITLVDLIRHAAEKNGAEVYSDDAESMGEEMYDCLQYGCESMEGVLALLHAAAVQAAEMKGRLQNIEDILGENYTLEELSSLVRGKKEA